MDFTQLISDFADRHGIANLGAEDNAAALDIDGTYILVRRFALPTLEADAFDTALEALVNLAETWRRLLADFRPVAKAAAEHSAEAPVFGSNAFVQV